MAFFDFFKPKWRHSDPEVRRKAVSSLPDSEEATVLRLASGDPVALVRQAALRRVCDWRRLAPLVATVEEAVAVDLRQRIEDLQLKEFFATQGSAKLELLATVSKDSVLAKIAFAEPDPEIRLAAMERIADPALLVEIARQNCGKIVGLRVIERLNDESLLHQLAREASSRAVRAQAQRKVEQMEAERNRPSAEARREEELANLAKQASELPLLPDLNMALRQCRDVQRRWQELALPGDERTPLLEEAWRRLETRRQEEAARLAAREDAQRQAAELGAQLSQLVARMEALATSTAPQAEADFARAREDWARLRAIAPEGVAASLDEAQIQAEATFLRSRELLATEQGAEADIVAHLHALPSLLAAQDLTQAGEMLAQAQQAFDAWRPRLLGRQEIAARLTQAREDLRVAQASHQAATEARRQANLLQRRQLLHELRELVAQDDQHQAEARSQEIQRLWRQPLDLPAEAAALEEEFQAAVRAVAEHVVLRREEQDWQRWQNTNLKAALLREAEALDQLTDPRQVFKRIKELQAEWRRIGPAQAKEEHALWRAFQEATERNFVRCRDFFASLDRQAEANLEAKRRLVAEAQALQDSQDWQASAEAFKGLQSQWKGIGRAPHGPEEEVFRDFRAACDHFFARRQAHYAAQDQAREGNRSQKEVLCQQAEALAAQPELSAKSAFQDLQANWKKIGPAPKEQEEALWQRFRAACDQYYAWLDTLRPENLRRKVALCQEVEGLTADLDPESHLNQLAKTIAGLQRQWKEIGPVPAEEQEAIWQRFKGACDRFYGLKHQRDAAVDQARPANQARREALLARVRELTAQAVTRDTVREIIACQEEWQGLGPGDKDGDRQLRQEFSALCDAFFRERREAMQEIDRLQRDNLKRKEALCLRLEIVAGLDRQPSPAASSGQRGNGLTLAEQLKVAFATNFVLAAEDSRDKRRRVKDEVEAVRREWQQIGPVPREHEHALHRRYQTALADAMKALDEQGAS